MAQIFLSYSSTDTDTAHNIAQKLRSAGLDVWLAEEELSPGDSIVEKIGKQIASSNYIMVLLSRNSVESTWLHYELGMWFSKELRARDISVIPILIEDCEVPIYLRSIQMLDLRKEGAIDRFIDQIKGIVEIDFSRIDARTFEQLVGDLMQELGFSSIRHEVAVKNAHLDITAQIQRKDPFGKIQTEQWFVETKFYRDERPDIRSLHNLLLYLQALPEYRALLITNGQLTSVAREWLDDFPKETKSKLRIIDGPELKELLLMHPAVTKKYFSKANR